MWNVIGAVIGLLLAVYGAADLVMRLCWWLVFAGEEKPVFVAVTGEDAEYHIRRLAMWRHFCPHGVFVPTVVLTEENESLKRLCERVGLICKITLQAPSDTL